MSQQHINSGVTANDGTGDTLRTSQIKAESNFNELYGFVSETQSQYYSYVEGDPQTFEFDYPARYVFVGRQIIYPGTGWTQAGNIVTVGYADLPDGEEIFITT